MPKIEYIRGYYDTINNYKEEIKFLISRIDQLNTEIEYYKSKLAEADIVKSTLYSEIDNYKRGMREIANMGHVLIDKNGNISFPDIKETPGQHKDTTPEDMVEVFAGIYEVWEKHPELNISELVCGAFRKKAATMSNKEFIDILKNTYVEEE